ncbi:MAG: hypothetical protein ACK4NS_02070, partial [Saprospiraceae bacterium]
MKKNFTLLTLFLLATLAHGQVITWSLLGEPGNQVSTNSNFSAPNVGVGVLSRGPGVNPTAAANSINSNGWFSSSAPTTLDDAIANNDYYQFTVPIGNCFAADITSIEIWMQSSNTGPNTATLRSSVDNFTANLGTQTMTNSTGLKTFNANLNNVTGTVTFRLYGYGNAVSGTPGTGGTMRIGSTSGGLVVNGTVKPKPITALLSGEPAEDCAPRGGFAQLSVSIAGGTSPFDVTLFRPLLGDTTYQGYVSDGILSVAFNATGSITLVSVVDADGCAANPDSLSGSVSVTALTPPAIEGVALTNPTCANNDGAISLLVSAGVMPLTFAWSTPNGSGLQPDQQNQSGLSAGTYIVEITNGAGCTTDGVFTLNLPSNCDDCNLDPPTVTVPPIVCLGDTVTIIAVGAPGNSIEWFADLVGGAPLFVGPNFQVNNVNAPITFYVRQSNATECSPRIPVTLTPDVMAPVFLAPLPMDMTIPCEQPVPPAMVLSVEDDFDPNPQIVIISSIAPGDCPQEFFISRSWIATDACGNSAFVGQSITVVDDQAPVFNAPLPQNLTISCNDPIPDYTPNVTDNCDPAPTVLPASSITLGSCPQESVIFRSWTATDACGNLAVLTQEITIVDDEAPIFVGALPANLTLSCESPLPAPPTLLATDNCDPGQVPPVIFINEIHYDNAGADVNEFIEIAGTAGLDLSQYQLVLYNGSNPANAVVYNTRTLSGVIPNQSNGFGAVAFFYPVNGIQNGPNDGVALVRLPNTVLQLLSYEGPFTAGDGPAAGMTSTDMGVSQEPAPPIGQSLQLTGTGQTADDFTWVGPLAESPGLLNAGQTINALPGFVTAVFSEMMTQGACSGEKTITRIWTATDACGNMAMHTQTIQVIDDGAPVFAPPLPANITINCSDPTPAPATLTATDLCDDGSPMEMVWFNEIHYDNVGTDVNEFIEIAGTAGVDLTGYQIWLYNGADGAPYNTRNLSGVIPNQSNGFGTVVFTYPVNGIQNGSPDGMALVKNGMVIQFLSYEGSFVAVGGPANGMTSVDIGVQEDMPVPPVGFSLQLTGSGNKYADFTWTGPIPETPGQPNAGQTFIALSTGLQVTFNQTTQQGSCPDNRTITRTWTVSDDCGNTASHVQVITVQDITPPQVNCQPVTLNLNIFGEATLNASQINYTATDNCTPTNELILLPNSVTYNCDQAGTNQIFTLSVQDRCGNIGTCAVQVSIAPFDRCTPTIEISEPCVCKNNATNLTNGQFGETIYVRSLAGKNWTVVSASGLFAANSPAPPFTPFPILAGTALVENPVNSGDYFLSGVHVDDIGYTLIVTDGTFTLTISNKCAYPNPAITSDLGGPFCLGSAIVPLTGDPGDANIVSANFTINGAGATEFNPAALGLGQYTITYTVNGGVPKAAGANDPGCTQSVSQIVQVVSTPNNVTCNDLVHLSLDASCTAVVNPDMILEGTYGCFDDYTVVLTG